MTRFLLEKETFTITKQIKVRNIIFKKGDIISYTKALGEIVVIIPIERKGKYINMPIIFKGKDRKTLMRKSLKYINEIKELLK